MYNDDEGILSKFTHLSIHSEYNASRMKKFPLP